MEAKQRDETVIKYETGMTDGVEYILGIVEKTLGMFKSLAAKNERVARNKMFGCVVLKFTDCF